MLEEYISNCKNRSEMIEKIKQENDCLRLVYKKNVSTISSKILSFIFVKNIFAIIIKLLIE